MKKQGILIFQWHGLRVSRSQCRQNSASVCVYSACVRVYSVRVCTAVCTLYVCVLSGTTTIRVHVWALGTQSLYGGACVMSIKRPPSNTHTHEFQEWCHPFSLLYKAGRSTLGAEVVRRSSQWGILMRFHDVAFLPPSFAVLWQRSGAG